MKLPVAVTFEKINNFWDLKNTIMKRKRLILYNSLRFFFLSKINSSCGGCGSVKEKGKRKS